VNAPLPRHWVSVAGIVVDASGQVLVIKRADNGHWEPPGGVLELGETLEEGVRREILEETGVNVEVVGLTGVYKNLSKGVVALVYRCTPLTGTPRPTVEAREVRWMAPEDAAAVMVPTFAVRVRDALDGAVHSRTHDGVTVNLGSRP
jgi:8-oxo-dGTP diphosphatase